MSEAERHFPSIAEIAPREVPEAFRRRGSVIPTLLDLLLVHNGAQPALRASGRTGGCRGGSQRRQTRSVRPRHTTR